MRGEVKELTRLLKNTQRMAVINGKPMPQVLGCVILCSGNVAKATSIVRDGITSISQMSCDILSDADEEIIIPDIAKLLAVLKTHSGIVKLEQTDDKLRVSTSKKTTTLAASKDALAFPHTTKSISEWSDESIEKMAKITNDGYVLRDGRTHPYSVVLQISPNDLVDAITSANINGQKVSRYILEGNAEGFSMYVGDDMRGLVATLLDAIPCDDFATTVEGGLENLEYGENLSLRVLDFTDLGQGKDIVLISEGIRLYQRGIE